jgi:arylsulfatase A-like enzyme
MEKPRTFESIRHRGIPRNDPSPTIMTPTPIPRLILPIAVACGFVTASPGASPVPDILLVMPDQMRGDAVSALGHPVVRTPELDRLAGEGVLFRRAYATVPSCIPARYAFLTGLYPQTSGVVGYTRNTKPLATQPFPELLADAGYATVLVGRNMHQPEASGDCGYEKRILGSTYVERDAYDLFLREAAPQTGGIRKLVETMGVSFNHWQAKPWPLADELHPTEWTMAESREVVRETEADRPLFLTASFYAPHPPLFAPKTFHDAYAARDLPEPARGDWVEWDQLSPEGDGAGHRVRLQGEALRAAQAGYFGLIEHLDAQMAALIRDFKARSENAGRPWVIVFTSDHGEMLGDHGYFRKCQPYEGSANVPLVITGSPELGFEPGTRIDRPVCLEDLMPTVLALAGLETPDHVDGVNLVPSLRGEPQTIRDWLHFEHAPIYSEKQGFHALTDGRFKYIWRPVDGAEQLFDLDTDPHELKDLAPDPAHRDRLGAWRARLVRRLSDRPEGFVRDGALVAGRPYRPLNPGTLKMRQADAAD